MDNLPTNQNDNNLINNDDPQADSDNKLTQPLFDPKVQPPIKSEPSEHHQQPTISTPPIPSHTPTVTQPPASPIPPTTTAPIPQQPITPVQPVSPRPGSPTGIPGGETPPITETLPKAPETFVETGVEDSVETSVEKVKPQETLETPELPSLKDQLDSQKKEETKQNLTTTTTSTEVDNVVDKTEEITELHHIKKPEDKLTKEADEEEENFIKEVEKHHGHN